MQFSEKAIEDLIVNALESGEGDKLIKRGFYSLSGCHLLFRQFNLGDYGRLDLATVAYNTEDQEIGAWKRIRINVIEIKKGEVNYSTFIQAIRYCKGIEKLLEVYHITPLFYITLIGTSMCQSDFCYLPDFFDNLSIYTISLNLDTGIKFKTEHDYEIKNSKVPYVSVENIHSLRSHMISQTRKKVLQDNPF